jgi:SAM-dependent methyltransferase
VDGSRRYVPDQYWTALHQRGDLSAVGQSGLPPETNAWLYRTVAANVDRFLARHAVRLHPPDAAFEVGVGIGYWLPRWWSLGAARVDGCDLVPAAVDRLNATIPPERGRYRAADISQGGAAGDDRYAFVAVVNVLLHIMDEDRFDAALANVARLVAPGGWLFLAEPILLHPRWERPIGGGASSRTRPRSRYLRPLLEGGLRLVALEAGTALGSNPFEERWRLGYAAFRGWWMLMAGTSRLVPASAALTGRVVRALDRPLLNLGAAPSTKFALLQRPAAEA